MRHLWIPSSAFVMPDWMQVPVGDKVVGLGLLELGRRDLRFELSSPEGMLRHDLSRLPIASPVNATETKRERAGARAAPAL